MTSNTKKITLVSGIVVLVAILTCAILAFTGVFAGAETWSDSTIEQEYDFRSVFTVPTRTVSVGGQTLEATSTVVFPDGNATVAKSVALEQVGDYQVRYSAKSGDNVYSCTETFTVKQKFISASGPNTTYGYGLGRYSDWRPEGIALDKLDGFLVKLAEGETVYFNKYIDLDEYNFEKTLFNFFIDPQNRGVQDVTEMFFRFTDALDPSIYVTLRIYPYVDHGGVFITIGANGQDMKGYYQYISDGVDADGNKKNVTYPDLRGYRSGTTGTSVPMSFIGQEYDWNKYLLFDQPSNRYMTGFFYDKETQIWETNYSNYGNGGQHFIIADLDDSNAFETVFRGFPSGKMYLSMWASGYSSPCLDVYFTEIFGLNYSELKDCNKTDINDTEPPILTVHEDEYSWVEGKIGGEYPLPTADALDVYTGACPVNVAVWYEDKVQIDITSNNTFVPVYSGCYTIIYSTKDAYGNKTEQKFQVHAGNPIPLISVTYNHSADYCTTTAVLGEYCKVAQPVLAGGSGKLSCKVFAQINDIRFEVNEGFYPEVAGVWTVSYVANDFVGNQTTESYNVTVTLGDKPMLVDSPELPKYFLQGLTNVVPALTANDYRTGSLVRKACDVEVTDADGTQTLVSGQTFTPTVTNQCDTIKLVYKCEGFVMAEYNIPTIQAFAINPKNNRKSLYIENYFVDLLGNGNFNINKSPNIEEPGILIENTKGTASWEFAKDISAGDLSLTFGTVADNAKFSVITFTLTDAYNHDVSVSMSLVRDGSTYIVYNNVGKWCGDLGYDFNLGTKEFVVSFDDNAIKIGKIVANCDVTDNGKPFEGFASNKVYVSLTVNSTTDNVIRLRELNGYTFSDATRDMIAPQITILGVYGGTYIAGDIYTVSSAIATDVLDPHVDFALTVKDPNGNIVTSTDGTVLENVDCSRNYDILLTTFGQYSVTYLAKDASGSSNGGYVINVRDSVAPQFHFEKGFKTTAKVGETYYIPQYTLSDDISASENITSYAIVITSNGQVISLKGNLFKFNYAGTYEFRFYAFDEANNAQFVTVKVTVQD